MYPKRIQNGSAGSVNKASTAVQKLPGHDSPRQLQQPVWSPSRLDTHGILSVLSTDPQVGLPILLATFRGVARTCQKRFQSVSKMHLKRNQNVTKRERNQNVTKIMVA